MSGGGRERERGPARDGAPVNRPDPVTHHPPSRAPPHAPGTPSHRRLGPAGTCGSEDGGEMKRKKRRRQDRLLPPRALTALRSSAFSRPRLVPRPVVEPVPQAVQVAVHQELCDAWCLVGMGRGARERHRKKNNSARSERAKGTRPAATPPISRSKTTHDS